MRRIIGVLVVLTVVLSSLIAIRMYTQAAALRAAAGGSGEIEGVEVDLSSRVSARVKALHVKKGDHVRKDAPLVTLDCADLQATYDEGVARLTAAQAQANAARVSIDSARRSEQAFTSAQAAAQAQAEALEAQRAAAARQADRLRAIGSDVSQSSLDQAQAAALGLQHQVVAAKAQAGASAEQTRAASAAALAATAQAEAAKATVAAANAAVARAQLMLAECEIRAPRDGDIALLPYELGELVAPGTTVVRLVDLSLAKATFYLPNAEIAAVRPGAKAEVVADAYPDERFEGRVDTVALEAEFTPRNIQTRTDRDRLVYPVEVLIPNPQARLRSGMPVHVTVVSEDRP